MRMFNVVYLLASSAIITSQAVRGEECGSPGRPVNGSSTLVGGIHRPGTRVRFDCNSGFVLFGSQERICLSNGTWSGELPTCDFNLARGKSTLQSSTLWSYKSELAVDGKPASCSFTPRNGDQRWWQVHLGHRFNVMSVGVTINPTSYQEFTIFVIELLSDNKAIYKPCTTFRGTFQTDRRLFRCNDGLGHPGQFVYIRDDRDENEYFGLCEVQVFAYREQVPCGEPEQPAHGTVTRVTRGQAQYGCRSGYQLDGNKTRNCTKTGHWKGNTPRCKMVRCSPPSAIENGVVEVSNYNGGYIFDTLASYKCNPGYIIWGNTTRRCLQSGDWSSKPPECKPISCGYPPTFPRSQMSLVNGSTLWRSHATYACEPGYNMDAAVPAPISVCEDSGSWSRVNVTCEQTSAPGVASVVPQPARRPDNVVQEPVMSTGAVIAVSVVAGMLIGLMIVMVILVTCKKLRFRKHKQPPSNMSSTNHLIGTPEKDSVLQQSPTSHFGDPKFTFGPIYPPADSKSPSTPRITSTPLPQVLRPPPTPVPSSPRETLYPMESYLRALNTSRNGSPELGKSEPEEDPNYEKLSSSREDGSGNQEPPYEKIHNGDPDYETIKRKKSIKDPDYETIKKRRYSRFEDPNYETIKPLRKKNDGGVLTHAKRSSSSSVPDILQNVKDSNSDPPSSVSSDADVPPEIFALYAKVDKSKKRKSRDFFSKSVEDLYSCPENLAEAETLVIVNCNKNSEQTRVSNLNKLNQKPQENLTSTVSKISQSVPDAAVIYASLKHENNKHYKEQLLDQKEQDYDSVVYSTILRPLPPLPADSAADSTYNSMSDAGSDASEYEIVDAGAKTRR